MSTKAAKPVKPTLAAKPKAKETKAEEVKETKTPAKPGKKPANPKNAAKNAESSAKRAAEQKRYESALVVAAERGLVTVFEELVTPSSQEKFATAVTKHLLETINNIQQTEVRKEGDYNPYPSKSFVLYEDKMEASSKKRTVKTSKSDSSSSAKKKKAPLKRGQKHTDEPEPEDEDEEQEVPLDDSNEAAEENPEASAETRKKNITTFSRDAKNYLSFAVMRFVDDIFSSNGGKSVRTREDFTKFVYENITKDIRSHMSRSVVTSVNRMREVVSGLSDRKVPEYFGEVICSHFSDRNNLVRFMGEYLSDYLKLIGHTLGQQLWVSRKTINQQALEAVVRVLDMGNREFMLSHGHAKSEDPDCGLSAGFYQDSHAFSELVLPPKAPKAAPKGKGKASKAKSKAKEDEDGDNAEEENAEEENAEDENADEDENAEEEEPEDDAEGEEVEIEEEEEAPEPPKPLKKLARK